MTNITSMELLNILIKLNKLLNWKEFKLIY